MKIAIALVLPLCCLSLCHDAWAYPSRYVLEMRSVKSAIKDDENKIVALKDKKLNRIVWTRKVYNPQVTWSKDHRAIAVEGTWHILVWRDGLPLRDFDLPTPSYGLEDYSMGCAWSPDNRRLLLRAGSSGSSMVGDNGAGALFSLKLGPQSRFKFTYIASQVTDTKWRDNRTVFYEAIDYNAKPEAVLKKHVWRAP